MNDCERAFEEAIDAFGDSVERKKRVLVRVYGKLVKLSGSARQQTKILKFLSIQKRLHFLYQPQRRA